MKTEKIDRIIALKAKIAKMKPLYDELDVLTMELYAKGGIHRGKKFDVFIVDNFECKNTAYRTTSFKRYESVVIKK